MDRTITLTEDDAALHALGLAPKARHSAAMSPASMSASPSGSPRTKSTKIRSEHLDSVKRAIATDNINTFLAVVNDVFRGVPHSTVHSIPFNEDGWCLPHIAASNDAFNVLQWCHDNGCDLNMQTRDKGWTPMHFAAFNATERCCAFLRHVQADLDVVDIYGDKPSAIAQMVGQPQIAELLGDDSAARAERERQEAEYRKVLEEARQLEEAREREEQRKLEAIKEEEERKARRAERLLRNRKLKALFEDERLTLVSKWLQQRQNIIREEIQTAEWIAFSFIFGADQVERIMVQMEIERRAQELLSKDSFIAGLGSPVEEDPFASSMKRSLSRRKSRAKLSISEGDGGSSMNLLSRKKSMATSGDLKRRMTRKRSIFFKGEGADDEPEESPEERHQAAYDACAALIKSGTEYSALPDPFALLPFYLEDVIIVPPPKGMLTKKKKQDLAKFKKMLEAERKARLERQAEAQRDHEEKCIREQESLIEEEAILRLEISLQWYVPLGAVAQKDPMIDRKHKGIFGYHYSLGGQIGSPTGRAGGGGTSTPGKQSLSRRGSSFGSSVTPSTSEISPSRSTTRALLAMRRRRRSSAVGFAEADRSLDSLAFGARVDEIDPLTASLPDFSALDTDDPNTHPYEATCYWSCCMQEEVVCCGCDPVEDLLRVPHHRGEYKYHLPHCTCGKMSSSGSGITFCNPGGFVWSCCGATTGDADGCMHHRRFLFGPNYYVDQKMTDQPERAMDTLVAAIQEAMGEMSIAFDAFGASGGLDATTSSQRPPSALDATLPRGAMPPDRSLLTPGGGSSLAAPPRSPLVPGFGEDMLPATPGGKSLGGTLRPKQLPQVPADRLAAERRVRKPSMSASALIGTIPNISETFSRGGESVVAQRRRSVSSGAAPRGRDKRRLSMLATTAASAIDQNALEVIAKGTFNQELLYNSTFANFCTETIKVSDSGSVVSHRMATNPKKEITRTNVYGHCPMDCSGHKDNIFCFSIVVSKCPVPEALTDEKMVIGIAYADFNQVEDPALRKKHGVVNSEGDDSSDESDDSWDSDDTSGGGGAFGFAGDPVTRAEQLKKNHKEQKKMRHMKKERRSSSVSETSIMPSPTKSLHRAVSRKKIDIMTKVSGRDEHTLVEQGDLSPSKIAAEQFKHQAKVQTAKRAPKTIRDALKGQFISGDLGLGWWAHTKEIRGLGVKTESSVAYKEGDTVTIVVDGLNSFVHFFVNRDLVAQVSVNTRRAFRPAITLVAGCSIISESSYKRTSLAFVEQYMREKAMVERMFRLANSGTAAAISEYANINKTSGLRRYKSSSGLKNDFGSESTIVDPHDSEEEEEAAARIMFD